MEVQKHPHHVAHKKKWHEYILEFAMLFLAVFLGFMAENMREHQVEHEREREYMATMVEDLKADIPLLDSTKLQMERANKSIDSVADAILNSAGATDLQKVYRHINEALNPWSFRYNDRTIAQLKNAGGFRLLRNEKVANSIVAYDQFNNDALVNMASQHNSLYLTAVALRNKVLVQQIIGAIFSRSGYRPSMIAADPWLDSMIRENRIPVQEASLNALMFEFKNAILAYKQDYINNLSDGYRDVRKKQLDLIELISKEYHLD